MPFELDLVSNAIALELVVDVVPAIAPITSTTRKRVRAVRVALQQLELRKRGEGSVLTAAVHERGLLMAGAVLSTPYMPVFRPRRSRKVPLRLAEGTNLLGTYPGCRD